MNAPHFQTRLEAELGRAVVRIAELEDEVIRLRDMLRIDRGVGTPIEWGLTPKQSDLVMAMASKAPHLLTPTAALFLVWPDVQPQEKTLDVMVCHIRKKLKPFGFKVFTVWGTGYYLSANAIEAIKDYRRAMQANELNAPATEAAG